MRFAATFAVLAAVAVAVVLAFQLQDGDSESHASTPTMPGQPSVEVLTPRNGSRHQNNSVIVRVAVENFELAHDHFGQQPRLGEGHLKFSLNRVPDCVDPVKLEQAMNSPRGSGRLTGASFDFPEHSGPNGILAERIGTAGSYSPSTEPQIFYSDLPRGFYRLVITLARNNGTTMPAHTVTTFEILPSSGKTDDRPECEPGFVAAAEAAEQVR